MAEHQLTLLIPETAEKARAELFSALKLADNPSAWMDFMETVTRLLPDILSSGRPSTESINRSAIGQLGFKSWQAMIEAPTDAHGLGWNFSAWKAWRRAWATVQAHPWLRVQPFTYSEINTWSNDLKRADVPFPSSLEALHELQKAKASTTEQKRSETLAEAQKAAQEALAAATTLRDQLTEAVSRENKLAEEIGSLKGQLKSALVEIDTLRPSVLDQGGSSTAPAKLRRNWWSRLLAYLGFGA